MHYFNLSLESGTVHASAWATLVLSAPCILGKVVTSHSEIISGELSSTTEESASTTSFCHRNSPLGW